jgi:hypothetical protein
MAFEITGKVVDIFPVNQVSDKFRKREFVIEKKESGGGAVFIDYVKFQLVQDKCELIDESFLHQDVKVYFNLKGNRWERDGKVNYFTNLDAWKIERAGDAGTGDITEQEPPFEDIPPDNDELSDLPF